MQVYGEEKDAREKGGARASGKFNKKFIFCAVRAKDCSAHNNEIKIIEFRRGV